MFSGHDDFYGFAVAGELDVEESVVGATADGESLDLQVLGEGFGESAADGESGSPAWLFGAGGHVSLLLWELDFEEEGAVDILECL